MPWQRPWALWLAVHAVRRQRADPQDGGTMTPDDKALVASLHDQGNLFRRTFGTDDDLIEAQAFVLEQQTAGCDSV